jgi:hypothetical protein
MNKYVDRYIYAVTRLLKPNQREEVRKELSEYIENSLKKDNSFEKTEQVLKKLGSPKELAYKYRNQGNNLIKQENYEFYLDVLKISLLAIFIFNIGVFAGALVNQIFIQGPSIESLIVYFFEGFFENIINNLLVGFAVVTLAFVVWERNGDKIGRTNEWMLKDLPEVTRFISKDQKSTNQILIETIASAFLSLFFLTVLRFPLLAVSLEIETFELIPASYDQYYIPFVLAVVIYIFNQIWLMVNGNDSVYKIINTFRSLYFLFFLGMFFFSGPFFVQEDIVFFAGQRNLSVDQFNLSTTVTLAITFLIILAWEIFENYLFWKKQ